MVVVVVAAAAAVVVVVVVVPVVEVVGFVVVVVVVTAQEPVTANKPKGSSRHARTLVWISLVLHAPPLPGAAARKLRRWRCDLNFTRPSQKAYKAGIPASLCRNPCHERSTL